MAAVSLFLRMYAVIFVTWTWTWTCSMRTWTCTWTWTREVRTWTCTWTCTVRTWTWTWTLRTWLQVWLGVTSMNTTIPGASNKNSVWVLPEQLNFEKTELTSYENSYIFSCMRNICIKFGFSFHIDPGRRQLVQLPVLTTTSRALEPNSETGRSRSLVRKRGTTYHNQSALLTV